MKQTLLGVGMLTVGISLASYFIGDVELMVESLKVWVCFLLILCGLGITLIRE